MEHGWVGEDGESCFNANIEANTPTEFHWEDGDTRLVYKISGHTTIATKC